MVENSAPLPVVTRRHLLGAASVGGLSLLARRAHAQSIDLLLPGGPGDRQITRAFPQKGPMILQLLTSGVRSGRNS